MINSVVPLLEGAGKSMKQTNTSRSETKSITQAGISKTDDSVSDRKTTSWIFTKINE